MKCQRCGSNSYLQAHHCFGKKAYPSARWLKKNGVLLCAGCHFVAHQKPEEFRPFLVERFGATGFEALMRRCQIRFQLRKHNIQLVKDHMDGVVPDYVESERDKQDGKDQGD